MSAGNGCAVLCACMPNMRAHVAVEVIEELYVSSKRDILPNKFASGFDGAASCVFEMQPSCAWSGNL